MKDQPLNSQILRTATLCHLIGLMWLPNAIGIFYLMELIWRVNSGGNLNFFFVALLTVPTAGLLLSALMATIFWKINKRKHSFIEKSGRKAVNFNCSCSLYLAIPYGLMVTTWLLAARSEILLSISTSLMGLYIFLFLVILLSHPFLSIAGAILTAQGKFYSYILSLEFFKEAS
jgi:uncharacterized Tic20 family protein